MANNYAFLHKIADPGAQKAVKATLDRVGALETKVSGIGTVTKPLTIPMDAGKQYLQNIRDPAQAQDAVTLNYLQTYVANIAKQLQDQITAAAAASSGGTPSTPPFDDNIANHLAVVQAQAITYGIGPASTDQDKYHFVRAVAILLETADVGVTCGMLEGPVGGSNVYTCGGVTYRISRVVYDNGHVFKILEDADPGGANTPSWDDDGAIDVSFWRDSTASGAC